MDAKAKRKAYRAAYHVRNREAENKKNLERYHAKYKHDEKIMERRRETCREYSKRMGTAWSRLRSKKYRKAYAKLSPATRFKIREAYKKWAELNWEKRVEYAREYRRRQPLCGFRQAIAQAASSGDIRKLAERCESAFAKLDEISGRRANKS